MPISLELHFTYRSEPVLQRTVFNCAFLNAPRIAVRGKDARSWGSNGSFEWSRAVRALSRIILLHACRKHAVLVGADALSFEYALGKKPMWLQEMFCPEGNRSFLTRIFKREGARNSPELSISLSHAFWHDARVKVWINNRVAERGEIESLLNALSNEKSVGSDCSSKLLDVLQSSYENELRIVLPRTQVLEPRGLKSYAQFYSRLTSLDTFTPHKFIHWLAHYQAPVSHGLTKEQIIEGLQSREPINIMCPAANIANMALLEWLRVKWKIPLRITCAYSTAFWLVADVASNRLHLDCDIVSLGLIPSLRFLGLPVTQEYELFMPSCLGTQTIASPKLGLGSGSGSPLHYFRDEPSNLSTITDPIYSKFGWNSFSHGSISEIISGLIDPECSYSGAFMTPFGDIAASYGAKTALLGTDPSSMPLYIILAHRRFLSDPRALLFQQAFKRAWIEILFAKDGWQKASKLIANNEEMGFRLIEEGGLGVVS